AHSGQAHDSDSGPVFRKGAIVAEGATLPKRIVGSGRRLGYTADTFSRGLSYAYYDHPDALSAGTGGQLASAAASGQYDPGDGCGPVCRPLAETPHAAHRCAVGRDAGLGPAAWFPRHHGIRLSRHAGAGTGRTLAEESQGP